MYHMFSRILSYETGIMIGCSNYGGVPLAERLVGLTTQDIESASYENNRPLTKKMDLFTKALSISCPALSHAPKAANMAPRESFAMLK